MLSNKEKSILEFLLQNKNRMVSSKEAADRLKMSDRTIRNYIKGLQDVLSKNGAEIIARTGQGYTVKVNNEAEFNTFLQKNDSKSIKKTELLFEESKDRQYYILNKLFFKDVYVLFDNLCDELYVSRSTLSNDFTEIRNMLETYNLSVVSKVKKGVYIEGDELDKRHFIMDYFFGNSFNISINQYVGNTLFLNDISFEEITSIVLDECREAGLKLSDYIIQNLILHIALLIKRIKDGFNLVEGKSKKIIENEKEFLVAKSILERITISKGIDLPNEEISYIALYLKVNAFSKKECELNNNAELYNELICILKDIENDTGYELKNDQKLIDGLITHFYPLLMRLKNRVVLENPLLKEIKQEYKEVFEMTKEYLTPMSIFKDYKISDSEWGYICFHFMAAIERFKTNKKINVLVICATGYGSGQMLSIRLKKEFGQQINVVDVIGYYEITDEILKGVDLIVSSIDLYTVVFNIPIIHVSVFLNDNEINELKRFIDKKVSYVNRNKFRNNSETISEKKILVDDVLKEDCFHKLKGSVNKEQVIETLIDSLQKYEDPNYSRIMINQIVQREFMSSVIFSKEIAVPHPVKSVGNNTHIAVAVSEEGIYWNEEFPKVKLIFLLSPSKFENANIKNITKSIVSLTENYEIQEKILLADSFEEFKDIFKKIV